MDWLIGHLIGDYLLQNDWMALNKKRDSTPCAIHCMIWTLSVYFCQAASHPWPTWTIPILFVSHFVQDRTEIVRWIMEHKGQRGFAQAPMAPWSLVVVDNVLHLFALWIIARVA